MFFVVPPEKTGMGTLVVDTFVTSGGGGEMADGVREGGWRERTWEVMVGDGVWWCVVVGGRVSCI